MGLFGRWLHRNQALADPDVALAIGRAVDRVDPLLRQVAGYPERYADGVARGLAYARELAARVPGPLNIDRAHFASDPTVHALFASVDEVKAAMCASKAMRDYAEARPLATEVYALMGMRRRTKNALGIDLEGDILRREVPQTLVYFTDHTIVQPAESEAESREGIAWGLFDGLVEHVRRRIDARREEKMTLDRDKDALLARLRLRNGDERKALQTQLADLLERLTAATASLEPRRYADDFDAVFGQPETHVYLNEVAITLDGMGVLRSEGGTHTGQPVNFVDLIGRDRRRWTITLVHCRDIERTTLSEQLEKANRWLTI